MWKQNENQNESQNEIDTPSELGKKYAMVKEIHECSLTRISDKIVETNLLLKDN